MTDLKQEISRIQKAEQDTRNQYPGVNKWYEITKIAYERGELIKLLSADEEYIYDSEGRFWLRYSGPDWDLDANPIDIRAIVDNGLYELCTPDNKSELKQTITNVFYTMLDGTPEQVYFAVHIFSSLAIGDLNETSPFYDWINGVNFTDSLRLKLATTINQRESELKRVSFFNTVNFKNGLFDWILRKDQSLKKRGIKGFCEV